MRVHHATNKTAPLPALQWYLIPIPHTTSTTFHFHSFVAPSLSWGRGGRSVRTIVLFFLRIELVFRVVYLSNATSHIHQYLPLERSGCAELIRALVNSVAGERGGAGVWSEVAGGWGGLLIATT